MAESNVLFEQFCWTKSEPAAYQILQNNFAPGVVFTASQRLVATYTVLLEVAGSGTGSQATHTIFGCGVRVNVVVPCDFRDCLPIFLPSDCHSLRCRLWTLALALGLLTAGAPAAQVLAAKP